MISDEVTFLPIFSFHLYEMRNVQKTNNPFPTITALKNHYIILFAITHVKTQHIFTKFKDNYYRNLLKYHNYANY